MGRGSICSWQDYGRRSSATVQQFSSRTEFMTDDIEYKRGDGWFLSYPKVAAVIVVFLIGLFAAGFLGWYINSLPQKKSHGTPDLIRDEIEDTEIPGKSLISGFVRPLKYRVELAPIIEANDVSKMKGQVFIEFEVEGTSRLSKLSLNAKNIVTTGYKLSLLEEGEVKGRLRRRRRRHSQEESNNETYEEAKTLDLANETMLNEVDEDYNYTNATFSSYDIKNVTNTTEDEDFIASSFSDSSKTSSTEIEISEYKVVDAKEIHVLYFGADIGEGNYSLEINYETSINDSAFYKADFFESEMQKWLIARKPNIFGVRHLLPVFDDVNLKSPFWLTVRRPKNIRVLSNMPIRTSREISENWTVDYFDETPVLSPHNLGFAMGHIETVAEKPVDGNKVKGTFWADTERHSPGIYLHDKLDPVVINLIDFFSMAYPLPKLDLLALPSGIDENAGNPGLIAMKHSVYYTSHESPLIMKSDALKTLVYLIGQQWLGGFINMNWTDLWILEGTLLFLQHELIPKIDSSLDSSNSFLIDVQLRAMEIDGYSISRPIQTNVRHLHLDSHRDYFMKGACLMRMLHATINETAFTNGYRNFIARWSYQTTDATEFFRIMEEESNNLPSDVSLEKIVNSWISQSGYPIVTVIRNYKTGSAIIRQECFTRDKLLDVSDKLWHIPLTYVTENNNNWSTPAMTWMPPQKEIELNDINRDRSWILFNVNKTGYYRVRYDDENWLHLITAIDKNPEAFPAETKASLIDDIFSLAAIGLANYETAFNFIKYMQMKERHYAPWGSLMRHVFKLYSLLYETSVFTEFQESMLKFISSLYSEVGSKLTEGSQLTSIAVQMACTFEHTECLQWSKDNFEKIKVDSAARETVPPYIRKTLYCTIARHGTRQEWNYFLENATSIVDREEKNRFLSSFACFQAPWIFQSILDEIVHGDLFDEDEISIILRAFPQNPAAAQMAARFVRANWDNIIKRFPTSYKVLKSFMLSMVNGLTSEEDVEDHLEFREHHYDNIKGARFAAAIVEANANFVTSWLAKSLPEIEKLLKRDIFNNSA